VDDLRELYQQVILDHYKQPRNSGEIENANRHADGNNPLCGDKLHLTASVSDGKIEDIKFQASGCAISTASASLMSEAVKGKTVSEALALGEQFRGVVTGGTPELHDMGKLEVFAGVRDYPVRVKCAVLPWHTLRAALTQIEEEVTTE
jgi:nitrogen fixation NifU-like protein